MNTSSQALLNFYLTGEMSLKSQKKADHEKSFSDALSTIEKKVLSNKLKIKFINLEVLSKYSKLTPKIITHNNLITPEHKDLIDALNLKLRSYTVTDEFKEFIGSITKYSNPNLNKKWDSLRKKYNLLRTKLNKKRIFYPDLKEVFNQAEYQVNSINLDFKKFQFTQELYKHIDNVPRMDMQSMNIVLHDMNQRYNYMRKTLIAQKKPFQDLTYLMESLQAKIKKYADTQTINHSKETNAIAVPPCHQERSDALFAALQRMKTHTNQKTPIGTKINIITLAQEASVSHNTIYQNHAYYSEIMTQYKIGEMERRLFILDNALEKIKLEINLNTLPKTRKISIKTLISKTELTYDQFTQIKISTEPLKKKIKEVNELLNKMNAIS